MPAKTSLRDRDFYAWSLEQAALLREGRLAEADLEAIAEEIESMGKTEKRELVSRLTVLLLQLLKWRHQRSHRGKSWRLTIANARDDVADHLEDNRSLKAMLDRAMEQAYRTARRKAAIETEFDEDDFPERSPWTFAEARDPGFWPE
jgi:predicted  nucleic acid-binding Zn-ribbon protein